MDEGRALLGLGQLLLELREPGLVVIDLALDLIDAGRGLLVRRVALLDLLLDSLKLRHGVGGCHGGSDDGRARGAGEKPGEQGAEDLRPSAVGCGHVELPPRSGGLREAAARAYRPSHFTVWPLHTRFLHDSAPSGQPGGADQGGV